jgi:hypothetical protein
MARIAREVADAEAAEEARTASPHDAAPPTRARDGQSDEGRRDARRSAA